MTTAGDGERESDAFAGNAFARGLRRHAAPCPLARTARVAFGVLLLIVQAVALLLPIAALGGLLFEGVRQRSLACLASAGALIMLGWIMGHRPRARRR